MRTIAWVWVLLLTTTVLAADGMEQYLRGLDQLEAGKFTDAARQFQSAIDADDENPDFRIALGVALTLGEQLPQAVPVLQRAVKLSNNADEARLWLATAIAMQGEFSKDSEIYPFAIARNEYVNSIRAMSHEYGQAAFAQATAQRNGNNKWDVEYANQQLAKRQTLVASFPRYGKAFSQKMKAQLPAGQQQSAATDPEAAQRQASLSKAVMARIKSNVDKSDYVSAMHDINPMIAAGASDPQLLVYHGLCALHLGAPDIARRQFSRALYKWPLDGNLYALRAVASAQTGDKARAAMDATTAKGLGTNRAEWMDKQISAAPQASGDPPAMLKALYESARTGATYAQLVEGATQLVLAQNARRLRQDEQYIDGLRVLQMEINASPRDAVKLAALAGYLYDNAVNPRGEAVELRSAWHPYRSVNERAIELELSRALNVANEALSVDAGNVSAMITKAAVLVKQMRFADAEQFLKRALAQAPTEPRLLRLFAEVADRAAAAKQAQASALRTPTTWEDQFYIYTRYPSANEKAQADALDSHANQLWAVARQALEQAIEQSKNPAASAYFHSVLDRRAGKTASALAWAQKAASLEPKNLEYLDMVSTLLAQSGQKVQALLSQANATNLVHSTAGPVLKCVWLSLPQTKFKTSREYLDQAAEYDAADPRVAAYFGAVAGADDKTDVACAWYSVASALYEANARLEGVSVDSKEPSPLRADVATTMLNVNLRAAVLLRTSRPKDAEALARRNLGLESRIDDAVLFTPIPASMLPDLDANQIPVPQADHAGYLLSVSRLELGRALLAQRRYDEAIAELQQVQRYREKVPPTIDAGSKMQYPVAAAGIWTVSALLSSQNLTAAQERYRMMARPKQGLDAETSSELKRISELMSRHRAEEWNRQEQLDKQQQQNALDEAMRQRQQQIDSIDRRRKPGR